jgi:hypothetical protein
MKRKSGDRVRKTAVFVVGHKQDRLILARRIYHIYINTSTVFPFQLLPGTPLAALYCAIETAALARATGLGRSAALELA